MPVRSRRGGVVALVLATCFVPRGSARADEAAPSAEAQAAAAAAGRDVSTETFDAENLVYFLFYGGAALASADRVTQRLTGGVVAADDGVTGGPSWIAGLGLALIPPRFDWFAVEGHVELGPTVLDARLREGCAACAPSDGPEPTMFTMQAGVTLRATVPLRYLSLHVGAGPVVTTFVSDYVDWSPTPDQPATFEQWQGALGLRLVAGVHFLVAPDVRLFVDYRHDVYRDETAPADASSAVRGTRIDGLRVQSLAGGLELNVPEYQQSSIRGKTPFVAVPITAILVVGAFGIFSLAED